MWYACVLALLLEGMCRVAMMCVQCRSDACGIHAVLKCGWLSAGQYIMITWALPASWLLGQWLSAGQYIRGGIAMVARHVHSCINACEPSVELVCLCHSLWGSSLLVSKALLAPIRPPRVANGTRSRRRCGVCARPIARPPIVLFFHVTW